MSNTLWIAFPWVLASREFRTRLDTINESHDTITQRISSVPRAVRYVCDNAECESRSSSERD